MLKNIRANLARLISPPGLPTLNIPDAGTNPALRIVAQAAPAAPVAGASPLALRPVASRAIAGPAMVDTFRLYEEQLKLDFDLASKLALAATPDAHRQIRAAFAQFRASKLRGKTIGDIAKTPFALRPTGKAATPPPALDDDGVAQPIPTADDPIGDVIKQLEQCLKQLKESHPEVSADDADADEAEARLALAAGRKSEALKLLDSAVGKRGARIVAKKSRNPLLSEPSSPQRAHRLTASGFNEMPSVAALNTQLGRGGSLTLADRASLALAPVAGRTPPARPAAVATTTSAPPDVIKIRSIQAEIKSIDADYRKTGVFSPAAQARHATLSRELKAELKKFHVR